MRRTLKGLWLGLLLVAVPAFAAGLDGSKLALKDGRIDGADISFAVDVDFGGGPTTLQYTGVVAADSIALTFDIQGMPVNITAKRVAAK